MYQIQNKTFELKKFVTAKERKDSYFFLMKAYEQISKIENQSMFAVELLYPETDGVVTQNFKYWFDNLLDGDLDSIDYSEDNWDELEQVGIKVITDFFILKANSMKPKEL